MKCLLLALALSPALLAQDRNAVYGEIFGNGIGPTVNYERRLTGQWWGRVGLLYATTESASGDRDDFFIAPVMANHLSRPQANHHFEKGIGLVLLTGESDDWFSDSNVDEEFSTVIGTATLGYRYQRPDGGFVFRAGFTPLFDTETFVPWLGFSFGYAW